ncbi:MAG: diguanylate cyclase [Desulfovibrio sp.]
MRNRKIYSVALYLSGVLFLGLLLPIVIGMFVTLKAEQAELENELAAFQDETVEMLVESTEDAMLSFSPDGVSNMVQFLLKDERIVSIEVYSSIFDLYLIKVSKKTNEDTYDSLYSRGTVSNGEEDLGYVQIEVDRGWILPRIEAKRNDIITLFSTMFLGALLLVLPTIYLKVVRPLNRLKKQAEILSAGELGVACEWYGKDELALLGSTLDDMRVKLKENFNTIQELAVTDELTGLINRRGFNVEVEKMMRLSRRYNHPMVLAIFDLDYFKLVNDTHGHVIGDAVLREFSRMIELRVRSTDVFARIGGEEFVLVMPETPLDRARDILEELRETVSLSAFPHGERLTVSIGMIVYSGSGHLEQLLEDADKALYEAKEKGRNRVEIFSAYE